MKHKTYSGLMPAIITPFKKNGEVDVVGLQENVKFYVKEGCSGIVPNGSTGEAVNLNADERKLVIKAIKEVVPENVNVISGTGTPSTKATVKLTEEAIQAGADGVLVLTPYNAIPNKKGLRKHYMEIAETGADIILYNLPEHTGVAIELETIEALLKYPNIVAIKESSGDLVFLAEIIRRFGDRITAISGSDSLFFQCFLTGAPGAILALGNIAPKIIIEILELVQQSKLKEAREKYYKLLPIAGAIGDAMNFPAPVKEAVRLLGRPSSPPRMPILPVDADESAAIRKKLVYAGLLK